MDYWGLSNGIRAMVAPTKGTNVAEKKRLEKVEGVIRMFTKEQQKQAQLLQHQAEALKSLEAKMEAKMDASTAEILKKMEALLGREARGNTVMNECVHDYSHTLPPALMLPCIFCKRGLCYRAACKPPQLPSLPSLGYENRREGAMVNIVGEITGASMVEVGQDNKDRPLLPLLKIPPLNPPLLKSPPPPSSPPPPLSPPWMPPPSPPQLLAVQPPDPPPPLSEIKANSFQVSDHERHPSKMSVPQRNHHSPTPLSSPPPQLSSPSPPEIEVKEVRVMISISNQEGSIWNCRQNQVTSSQLAKVTECKPGTFKTTAPLNKVTEKGKLGQFKNGLKNIYWVKINTMGSRDKNQANNSNLSPRDIGFLGPQNFDLAKEEKKLDPLVIQLTLTTRLASIPSTYSCLSLRPIDKHSTCFSTPSPTTSKLTAFASPNLAPKTLGIIVRLVSPITVSKSLKIRTNDDYGSVLGTQMTAMADVQMLKLETIVFRAENNLLLSLIINSRYNNKEIFCRELIIIFVDVLTIVQFKSLADKSKLDSQPGLFIHFVPKKSFPTPPSKRTKTTIDKDDDSDVDLFGRNTEKEKKAIETSATAAIVSRKRKEEGNSSEMVDVKSWGNGDSEFNSDLISSLTGYASVLIYCLKNLKNGNPKIASIDLLKEVLPSGFYTMQNWEVLGFNNQYLSSRVIISKKGKVDEVVNRIFKAVGRVDVVTAGHTTKEGLKLEETKDEKQQESLKKKFVGFFLGTLMFYLHGWLLLVYLSFTPLHVNQITSMIYPFLHLEDKVKVWADGIDKPQTLVF